MSIRSTLLSSLAAISVMAGASGALAQTVAATQVITPDERSALSPGLHDAGQAAHGMALENTVAPPPGFFDPDALWSIPQTREEQRAYQERMRTNPPKY